MHNAQRILLAVSCLLCLALLKYLWTTTLLNAGLAQSYGRLHVDKDGFVACINPANASTENPQQATTLTTSTSSHCADLNGLEDVAMILKTGSTEIYEKLPIHYITTFSCIKDRLIYSDVQQYFSGESIRDAIALISEQSRALNNDLEEHERLQYHVGIGGDASELRSDKSWRIDKWKFLPMISDSYKTFGDSKKWYFFIEADTYVSLHNLLPWLSMLDHSQPIYAGAQVMIGHTEFGHGGSGFLLSSSAARALSEIYNKDKLYWEGLVAQDCCGDKIMADVLVAADPPIRILRSFPLIQGETVASLDWTATHWCRPAVTWHHVNPAGIDKMWQFEQRWRAEHGAHKPILFKDYYAAFVNPRIVAATNGKNVTLQAWDNLSNDWTFSSESTYSSTAQSCEQFCKETQSCMQWAWRPGSCRAGSKVRFGWALKNRPELGSAGNRIEEFEGWEEAISGWLVGRIEEFKQVMGECSTEEGRWVTKNK